MRSTRSTRKQVVVRKLDKGLVKGFVDPVRYLHPEGLEMLDRKGRLLHIPLDEVKGVFFVRKFEGNPNACERKVFHSRPRLAGLWVRLTFKDNEVMEGLVANNLLDMDPLGFSVTPPDLSSNNLRIFIPRSALSTFEVLGVVSESVAHRRPRQPAAPQTPPTDSAKQIGLFSPSDSEPAKPVASLTLKTGL